MAACLPSTAAGATAEVIADPALFPAYRRAVTDYVVRCPNRSLRIHAGGREPRTVPIEPGQSVRFSVRDEGRTTRHFVRCLPDDFPVWSYVRNGRQVPRWFFVSAGLSFGRKPKPFLAIFDHRGVPVWWYRTTSPLGHDTHLVDGNIAYSEASPGGFNANDAFAYRILRPDGSLVRTIRAVGSPTDFHDLQQVDGDWLVLTYRPRPHVDLSAYGGPADATVLDSEVQRVDGEGRLLWSWSSRDHVDLAETGRWWPDVIAAPLALPDGTPAYDTTHVNAIDRVGGDLLISMRHVDAVYRIRMRDGRIRWKLGGTPTSRSLQVLADPADYPLGGQHDVRLWRDTVTIHDNGTNLLRSPRVVRYEIESKERTATLLESVSDPRVPGSICCGSARKLEDGNWLVGWGGNGVSSLLTPRGRLVSRLTIDDYFSYRTVAAPESALSRARLRAGMDTMYAAAAAG